MRDKLSDFPGLAEQPKPGTVECEQLETELAFAIEDRGDDRKTCERTILKFMVSRGYWPLGTRVKVTKKFQVKATFPRLEQP